jgi:mannose-6-phosphate isomerase-like protein (cupin superfamily)
MRFLPKLSVVCVLSLLTSASYVRAAPSAVPGDTFTYLSRQDATKRLDKPGPKPVVSVLSSHEYYLSEIAARTQDGEVEVHEHWIDFMSILSGEVTLTYGGAAAGQRATEPGEMRGGRIVGGKQIKLHAGDYVEIPAGMPHLMTGPRGGFRYLIIKVRV